MKWSVIVVLAAAVFLVSMAPAALAAGGGSLKLTVYQDGFVHVSQTVPANTKATSIQVPLLSAQVSDLVATDQNGSPLSYQFSQSGDNITIYTLGASSATLTYDTGTLTSKNGTVWTLAFVSRYNSTVVLPDLSTLTSASGSPYTAPYTINGSGGAPELTLAPGTWNIAYGVYFTGLTTSSTQTGSGPGPSVTGGLSVEVGALLLAVAAAGAGYLLWRRSNQIPKSGELRPDDLQVLNFIREKGGKVLEPEIRMKFALPKTSAWRQIKRLERMGYVKVVKVGSLNQIELLKDGGQG